MAASDSGILDDPRGPSKSVVVPEVVCIDLLFLLDCVLARWSFPDGRSVAVFLLYSDKECLLSPHLKCSEVCFEKGVWGFSFFCSLSLLIGTKLRTSSQSVSCSAVIVLWFEAMTSEKLFPACWHRVCSASTCCSKGSSELSASCQLLYLGLIVHLCLCVFPAWVDRVS